MELLMASSSSLEVLQEEEVEREGLPARATLSRFSSALPSPISTSRAGLHLLYRSALFPDEFSKKNRNSNNLFTITRAGTRLAQKKTKTTKIT